jgi:hypothetical protein
MGAVVDHAPDLEYSLSAEALQSLLELQGLGAGVEARYDVELHRVR